MGAPRLRHSSPDRTELCRYLLHQLPAKRPPASSAQSNRDRYTVWRDANRAGNTVRIDLPTPRVTAPAAACVDAEGSYRGICAALVNSIVAHASALGIDVLDLLTVGHERYYAGWGVNYYLGAQTPCLKTASRPGWGLQVIHACEKCRIRVILERGKLEVMPAHSHTVKEVALGRRERPCRYLRTIPLR